MDLGSSSICDHFTNQIKFWGIQLRPTPSSPSARPTASPSGSHRPLKEQIIHGRMLGVRNIAELRDAVRDFVELYKAERIVDGKNIGYLSLAQARQASHAAKSWLSNR